MPTTNQGIYRITLEQSYQGKVVFNVFAYLHSLGSDDEQDKASEAFDDTIMADLASILSANLDFTSIRSVNVTGTLADNVITPSQSSGDVIGEDVASFVAAPFRYNRETKDTRNGSKRFCGMVEENMLTTGFTGAYATDLTAFAVILGGDISAVGGIFSPIILGQETGTPGTWIYNTLVGVQALNRSTSQVSRKVF